MVIRKNKTLDILLPHILAFPACALIVSVTFSVIMMPVILMILLIEYDLFGLWYFLLYFLGWAACVPVAARLEQYYVAIDTNPTISASIQYLVFITIVTAIKLTTNLL